MINACKSAGPSAVPVAARSRGASRIPAVLRRLGLVSPSPGSPQPLYVGEHTAVRRPASRITSKSGSSGRLRRPFRRAAPTAAAVLEAVLLLAATRGGRAASNASDLLFFPHSQRAGERWLGAGVRAGAAVGINSAPLARASPAGEGCHACLGHFVILLHRATANADGADRFALPVRERDAAGKRYEAAVGDLEAVQRRTRLA